MIGGHSVSSPIPELQKPKRARLAFYDAFLDLLAEKAYEDIPVSEIVFFSGYSRSAFYANFLDKDDMLAQMLDYYVLTYVHSTYDTYRDRPSEIKSSLYLPMLHTFKKACEEKKFYHLLFAGRIPDCDLNSFNHRTEAYFRRAFDVCYGDWSSDFDWDMYWFINGMKIFNFIIYWDMNDWKWSPEYMAKNAAKLLPHVSTVDLCANKKVSIKNNMSIPPVQKT